MNKASLTYVKKVLGDNKAKKKFGQNFLIDANIVEKIAKVASNKELLTIEIGPGLGALSEFLCLNSKEVEAYEIDKDMVDILNEEFKGLNFKVIHKDFLDVDLKQYENQKINIASNLPYYVTTPILFKIFKSNLDINKITVMVQKEVADRFNAKVNSEDYNALSLIVQYLFDVKLEMNVSKNCFYPAPQVDSAVVSFTPKIKRNFEYEEGLFEFIEKCFMKRRKTLNNNLKDFLDNETIKKIYDKLELNESVRAQELLLDNFIKMYEVIHD